MTRISFLNKRDPFNKEKIEKVEESLVDYEALEIVGEDKKNLIKCEKNIIFHREKVKEHLMSISETLYEAQQVLAKHGNGSFKIWFEKLGLKKDFVYMCLKRYSLYLEYNKENIMLLPDRTVKDLVRLNIEKNSEIILEILDSGKVGEKIKEIKESLSVRPTNFLENNIRNYKIEGELKKIEKNILKYKEKILELENQKKYLIEILQKCPK
ncbi:hypothetical protein SAMN02745174_01843 [Cetobacterium ceti]|uniref:Uncharacterized protein n=1 Tax=Cetobacterium ceti TaxID=180163 RepID=A0A1T4PAB1_9FUSO|nr:hypothetical protein [Cetobacterium ceti]SJZ88331.1 hypothetical protein SAMN02745174_01843 [Cetobacterium ceti]